VSRDRTAENSAARKPQQKPVIAAVAVAVEAVDLVNYIGKRAAAVTS